MASPLKLEVFETAEVLDHPTLLMPEEVEDLRLAAFERGYVAGYEDAQRQAEADAAAARARIAAAMEGVNFGYVEARAHVLKALEPLLAAILGSLLPALARRAIVAMTVEALMPLADDRAAQPLTLRIPAGTRAEFEAAFEGLRLPPLTLLEAPDLAEGQAEIRSGTEDCAVDLTALVARIEAALRDHYLPTLPEAEHARA